MNNRRNLLIVLGASAFKPRALFAQAKQPILIGWLHGGSRESNGHFLAAFKQGLAALGWKEGSNVVFEERWADGRTERLQSLAQELVVKKPAVIVAAPGTAVRAAVKATPTTPVVQAGGADLVATGLAASLARPGGMVTGVTNISIELTEKYLELLLVAAPKLRRVGFLWDPATLNSGLVKDAARRSAAQYQVEARFAEVTSPEEIEAAISRLEKEGAQALVVLPSQTFNTERRRIVKLALVQRWPIAGGDRWAEAGGLLSYSADTVANFHRAAYYVDRILKGTKPADLPIEQPTRFEMVVNLKTAKTLGLTMPPEIMARATRVIE